MRPYLAILKDSFREAFVSRVLWIVLVLLALVLVLIFPLTYRFSLTTEISNSDIVNAKDLVSRLVKAFELPDDQPEPEKSLVAEIASLIGQTEKQELREVIKQFNPPPKDSPRQGEDRKKERGFRQKISERQKQVDTITRVINQLILEKDLASLNSIDRQRLIPEAKSLLDSQRLEPIEKQRLNRLVIEQVFEDSLRSGPPTSIIFSYLSMEIPGKFPIEKDRLFYNVRAIIKYVLNFVFSTVGILMALIITSNIIPQTFDPGSLNLLLSKPISRWKLFVAQFLGGCAFITLTMSFFFIGVWLYLGSRLGYWNARLLLYIPSFIGIFAVYYSASAVAGLVWRSSIISVVAGASLWLLTFAMYTVNTFCETSFNSVAFRALDIYDGKQLVTYVPDHDRRVSLWNPDENQWDDLSEGLSSPFGMGLGPLYDKSTQHVFGGQQRMILRPFGPPTGGKMEILARDLSRPKDQFRPLDVGLSSVKQMFRRKDGRVLLFSSGRLHLPQWTGQDDPNQPEQNQDDKKPAPGQWSARSLGPKRAIRTGGTTAMAFNIATDELVVMGRGQLSIYAPNTAGLYELTQQKEFQQFRNGSLVLGFNRNSLLIFHTQQGATVINADTLEIEKEFGDSIRFLPSSVHPSPDGLWITLLRPNETVWNFSVESKTLVPLPVSNDVKTVAFDEKSGLHVADRWLRVLQVDPANGDVLSIQQGELTAFQSAYQRIIFPLYYVFPKCGELNYTVEYLVTGSDTADTLTTTFLKFLNVDRMIPVPMETYNLQPWPQVWNALIFIVVMLGIGCWIIERSDY